MAEVLNKILDGHSAAKGRRELAIPDFPSHHREAKGASGGRMAPVRFLMDASLFPADVLARTAHRYTGDFFVDLACSDNGHTVALTPKHQDVGITDIEGRFRNDALDERLRERIRAETTDLHVSLAQAALRQASPRGPSR